MRPELEEWIRAMVPRWVDGDRLIAALEDRVSMARIIFDLGRAYGRLEAANRL